MKIDFKQKFTNLNGDTLKDANTQKEMTLGEVCVEALLTVERDDPIDGNEKAKRYKLALDIHGNTKDSLMAEEIVLLKELIGKYYTPIIVGQAYPMLEG